MTTEDPEAAAAAPPPLTSPPAAAAQESSPPSAPPPPPAAQLPDSFDQLGLDARLLRGLSKMGISKPTAVQALTVPAALEGRDVVARARTGSGKTLAFLLPAFHAVARLSAAGDARAAAAAWRAVALVPTRELAEQVSDVADALAAASGIHLRTSTLAAAPAAAAAAASPRECQPRRCGQLVVSTPGRLASALADGRLTVAALAGLALLAIDEADLLLSLPGYAADLASAAAALPRSAQRLLLSATSAAAVDELGELLLQDPVRIDATGPDGGGGSGGEAAGGGGGASAAPLSSQPPLAGVAASVSHFFLEAPDASDAARLSTLIALLKLGAAKRRVLVFVADDDEGVKLRLALAAFGVRAARLGAALPLSSRHHALQEFNRGVFDYLIATDDGRGDSLCAPQQKKKEEEEEEDDGAEGEEGGGEERRRRAKKAGGNEGQRRGGGGGGGGCEEGEDFGVVRGIDFSGVRTVVNFSVPRSATSYVHRAGRTGRAGARGAVVTLFSKGGGRRGPGTAASGQRAALEASLVASGSSASGAPQFRLLPYPRLPPTAAAALRYRVDDVARALTRPAVREARAQELRRELLNSSRLAAHFSAAPRDLALLRHDAPLSAAGRAAAAGGGGLLGSGGGNGGGAAHLKRLPSYLMAAAGLRGKAAAAAVAAAASGGGGSAAKRAKDAARRAGGSNSKRTRDDGDPLRSLAAAAPAPEKQPAAAAEKKPAPVFFDRAPKRGGGEEAMTAVEKKAQIEGEKAARRLAKKQAPLLAKVAAAAQLKTAIAKKHRRR